MCRNLVSVDYQGYLYDCDFNQMLGVPHGGGAGTCAICSTRSSKARRSRGEHCYGCTAGQARAAAGRSASRH
jgi:hypothetical protein